MSVLDAIFSLSTYSAKIDVPIEQIDIADWHLALPEAEYQRCCGPDHIVTGATTTDDGRRMSINVDMIGTGLVVQHYVADEAGKTYCRMNLISDVFTANGRTQVNVTWELIAEPTADGRTPYGALDPLCLLLFDRADTGANDRGVGGRGQGVRSLTVLLADRAP